MACIEVKVVTSIETVALMRRLVLYEVSGVVRGGSGKCQPSGQASSAFTFSEEISISRQHQ